MRPMVVCLIAVLAACRVAPPSLSEADRAGIRAVTDSFVAHARAHRDSAGATLYTENASVMPPNGGIVEGRAAIRAWLQQFPPVAEFTLTEVEVDGRGDLAYVRGTYTLTMTDASGKPGAPDHGKYLEVRRRQTDGKWLIVVDIFNSDGPVK